MEIKKSSKLKIAIFSLISIVIIIAIAKYTTDYEFRNFINTKILNKQVTENSLTAIELKSDDNPTSFAYDKYIGVFAKNKLSVYNDKGNIENELSLTITTPLISTNGKYVTISEKSGNKFYVINSTSLLWQGNIDGKIEKININDDGYVSIIASNSTYKSIVIIYNSEGDELFKTYLPSTYAMCTSISSNNEYIAIGEVDYTGTVFKSNIRIMSISQAKLVYNYSAPDNEIIIDIKYCDKETATCMFSSSIINVTPSNGNKIYDLNDNISFANINMENYYALVERQSSGLFSYKYQLKFKSFNSNNENLYILDNKLPKQTVASGKIIALNYGSSVDIINQNGTLKKNYISTQQIKDIIVGEHIVGIVYKDKIEIINI